MKKILTTAAALAIGFSASSFAQETGTSLEELLTKVRNGRVTETAEHKKRESEFQRNKAKQQQMLKNERAEQARLERESSRLEDTRRKNEAEITRVLEQRRERLGQLQELFGVLQQAAGDAKAVIASSHVSIDYTGRMAEIDNLVAKASDTGELPTIEEIRSWPAQMILEMGESGRVVTFSHEVRNVEGVSEQIQLTRVGDFGIVGNGKFYMMAKDGSVEELPRQPASRFVDSVATFQGTSSGLADIGVDPSRGQILALEIEKPTIEERLDQGGFIGYLTLSLGAVGVFFAVVQFMYLFLVKAKVKAQIRREEPSDNNPLGRVLSVYHNNPNVDVETLELKLDEAILKETPALERFLTFIKLISAVAPLFGLLGTVTGMIETFQAITLFGTGDPTMMASGISAALMTTVEGLVVAIPTLLLHSFVAGSSKSVIHILEEQSAGIIAVHAEKGNS